MPFDRAWEKVSCPKFADNIGNNNNDNSKIKVNVINITNCEHISLTQ